MPRTLLHQLTTHSLLRLFLAVVPLLLLLAACAGAAKTNTPPAAVEAYLNALVSGDATQMKNLSCASWESQVQTELDSFAAVSLKLEDPSCQESGKNAASTLVSCSGKIIANYNGEDQDINLGDRIFQTVQENGEWRVCGYQ